MLEIVMDIGGGGQCVEVAALASIKVSGAK